MSKQYVKCSVQSDGEHLEDYDLKGEINKATQTLVSLMKYIDNTARDAEFELKKSKYKPSVEILHGLLQESLNEDLFVLMTEYVQFRSTIKQPKKAKRNLTEEFNNDAEGSKIV